MDNDQYSNGARPPDSTRKNPSSGIIVTYLAGAGIASIILTSAVQERLARPTFEVFSGFFFAFFALGILLFGWRKRRLKGSIPAAALVLAIAGVFWAFGGKGVDSLVNTICGLSLAFIVFKYFIGKRSQSREENADRR